MRLWIENTAPVHCTAGLLLALFVSSCGWVAVEPDKSGAALPLPPNASSTGPARTSAANAVQAVPGGRTVLVQPGDSVYGIAKQYDATPRQMIALNDLRPPFEIQSGQRLRLPPEQRLYTVRPGDTINGLGAAFRTDPDAIARLNHLPPPYVLHAGSVIGIPNARQAGPMVAARPAPAPRRRPLDQPVQQQTLPPLAKAPVPAATTQRVQTPKPPPIKARAPSVVSVPAPSVAAKPTPPSARVIPLPPRRPPGQVAAAPPTRSVPSAAQVPQASPSLVTKTKPTPQAKPTPQPSKPVQRGPAATKSGTSGGFLAPVEGAVIAKFGSQSDGRRNDGVNIAAARGTPVRASKAGEVVYAGDALQGYGKLLLVKHAGGWVTAYAHLDRMVAQRGDKVARGQTIGVVGKTGGVSAPQLHFEMRRNNKPVNPSGKLSAR